MINLFEVKKDKVITPLLVNIPHSSTYISPEMKAKFLLSENNLQKELLRMTDRYTDEIFSWFLKVHYPILISMLHGYFYSVN